MATHELNHYLRLIEQDGWTFQECGDRQAARWWRLRFRDQLTVFLLVDDGGMVFQLPLSDRRTEPDCHSALWRYLLYLNNELRVAKLAMDINGRLYLSAELAPGSTTYSSFSGTLTALATYYQQYHREIELVASNRDVARAWLSLVPELREKPVEIEILSRNPST